MGNTLLMNARARLCAFIGEIDRLRELEFPYAHSLQALELIKRNFDDRLKYIETLLQGDYDPTTQQTQASQTLRSMHDYLPVLGLIRRSTNVRNPFEVSGPLLRLAGDVLEPQVSQKERETKLILSSEWKYSPFIRHNDVVLKNFVVIGIPASESSNPLILSLAGHELGHSVWLKKNLKYQFSAQLQNSLADQIRTRWAEAIGFYPLLNNVRKNDILTNIEAKKAWFRAYEWANKQSEESFCDFFGINLFGESYLKAFSYLLAPRIAGPGSQFYPDMPVRVANQLEAAKRFTVIAPVDYLDMFESVPLPPMGVSDKFQLELAEEATKQLVPSLISKVDELVVEAQVLRPDAERANDILRRFELGVPAEKVLCIADILNAAWLAFESETIWRTDSNLFDNKQKFISELVLKSLEIFEIERILEQGKC